MLTNSELVLGAAGIGVLGSTVGGLIAWRASLSSAVAAVTEQRKLEADRRRDEQRTQLYLDMIFEQDKAARAAKRLMDGTAAASRIPTEDEFGQRARWAARVALFASPEVKDLWRRWYAILTECTDLHAKYGSANAGQGPDQERRADAALAGWTERIKSASDNLEDQMRRELEP